MRTITIMTLKKNRWRITDSVVGKTEITTYEDMQAYFNEDEKYSKFKDKDWCISCLSMRNWKDLVKGNYISMVIDKKNLVITFSTSPNEWYNECFIVTDDCVYIASTHREESAIVVGNVVSKPLLQAGSTFSYTPYFTVSRK